MKHIFPPRIAERIKGKAYTQNTVGKSGSTVLCFDDMVLKFELVSEESNREHAMLRWLQGRLPVPQILAAETAGGCNYLLMSRLPGEMACAEPLLQNQQALAALLAEGLRMLWRVDVSACPHSAMLEEKLRLAEARVAAGLCDMEDTEPGTYGAGGFKSPSALLAWLKANRPEETPALSHGDFCLPNLFIGNGKITGFIDLGRSGVADAYQDIALCYRSLHHNLNGHYGGKPIPNTDAAILFDALGIRPDWEKIRYYILLDELF